MKTFYKNQTAYLEFSVLDKKGDFVSGLTITYEIEKCIDNSLITSGTMGEINNTYTISYTFTEQGEYRIRYTTPTNYENGMESIIVEDYNNFKADISDLALEATVQEIKIDTESIITSLSTLVFDIWNYTARALTTFGSLISDIWSAITRTLTAGTKDSEIDSIKVTVESLDLELDGVAKETTLELVKTETNKIKYILGLSQENYRIFNPVYDVNNNLTTSTIKIYTTASDCNADINKIAEYQMTATYNSSNLMISYKVIQV